MDKRVVDQVWQQRPAQGRGRWTEPGMLDYELALLSPLVDSGCQILDLVNGSASLSSLLVDPSATLTMVDKYRGLLDGIALDPRISAWCYDVLDFDYPDIYDPILLFGVVTHLEMNEEVEVYGMTARGIARSDVLAVKNQVSRGAEERGDAYSEGLNCHYVGRYSGIEESAERLRCFFAKFKVQRYPAEFDQWPATSHACFSCTVSFE